MTHPTDLPAALPLAIAGALVALVVAPWLGGSEPEACGPPPASAHAVADAEIALASSVEPVEEPGCG
jgi:hypothetical protein